MPKPAQLTACSSQINVLKHHPTTTPCSCLTILAARLRLHTPKHKAAAHQEEAQQIAQL